MKKEAGTFCLSSRRRMRGSPSMAPYWPREITSEPRSPRESGTVALSTSKLKATATRAPFGHFFGFSRLPTPTCAYCAFNSSRPSFRPGMDTGGGVCAIAAPTINPKEKICFIDFCHDSIRPAEESRLGPIKIMIRNVVAGRLTRVRRRPNPGGRLRGAGRREVPQIQYQRAAGSVVHPNGRVALAEQIRDLARLAPHLNADSVGFVGRLNIQFRRERDRHFGIAVSVGIRIAPVPSLD